MKRRRILAIVMSLVMIMAIVPCGALSVYANQATCNSHTDWNALTEGGIKSSGNYYLTSDITLTSPIVFEGENATLCLNGNTLNTGTYGIINNAKVLTICDCSELSDGTIEGSSAIITNSVGCTLNINGGTIIAADVSTSDRGRGADNFGTLIMNGGKIVGFRGIQTGEGSYLRINYGIIEAKGRGISDIDSADYKIEIYGGLIAVSESYGICMNYNGNLVVHNGKIMGVRYGIYSKDNASITINGGYIYGAGSATYGGSIVINDGIVIGKNNASSYPKSQTINGGIVSFKTSGFADYNKENNTVDLYNYTAVGTCTIILADYDSTGRLANIKSIPKQFSSGKHNDIELPSDITLDIGDKIFLWNSMEKMVPQCNVYIVNDNTYYEEGTITSDGVDDGSIELPKVEF